MNCRAHVDLRLTKDGRRRGQDDVAPVHGRSSAIEARRGSDNGSILTSWRAHIHLRAVHRPVINGTLDQLGAQRGFQRPQTHSIAADSRNNRLPELTQLGPVREKVSLVHLGELLVLHLLDVGAGGKGLVGAGQDDAADAVIGRKGAEGRVELVEQSRVQGCRRRERDFRFPAGLTFVGLANVPGDAPAHHSGLLGG